MQDKQYFSQLEKYYHTYLQHQIGEKKFTPVILRGGMKKPDSWEILEQSIKCFQRYEKKMGAYGWIIEWEEWNSKKLNKQHWPAQIRVDHEEDYLALLKKEKEVARFKEQLLILLQWNPNIRPWLTKRPRKVLELENDWKGICAVIDYFYNNSLHEHYLRGLPVPVHTKFIRKHEAIILSLVKHLHPGICKQDSGNLETVLGLRQKPFLFPTRWLDIPLQQSLLPNMEFIGLTQESLQALNWPIKEIWIVENETTLYMLPPRPNALAICSEGYALSGLSDIPMLQQANLYYWSDMDEDGYNLLSMFRVLYQHAKSIFMDEACFNLHEPEVKHQPEKYKRQAPSRLTDTEVNTYNQLAALQGRIEQEKLKLSYVMDTISMM